MKTWIEKQKLRIAVTTLFVTAGMSGLYSACTKKNDQSSGIQAAATQNKKEHYQCSMHPSIVSDHPGICPICQMKLEKVDSDEAQAAEPEKNGDQKQAQGKDRKILFYRHPMRPDITSPTPQKDEMGMDYIPTYEDEVKEERNSGVQGHASFSLTNERQQLIGVSTTQVSVRSLGYEIRASGRVAFDPELYTAVEEYRQAIISRGQMDSGPLRRQSDELVTSAKTKLRIMGLGDDQIKTLSSGKSSSMSLLLPNGSAWVYAEVFEYEIQGLKAGFTVEVESPTAPGKIFHGKVSSVSPVVNSPSRTVRVRALVPDPEKLLRPDMYVSVKIKVDLGEKLAVPENSLLHSGDQTFVFVSKEKGKFEPRPIRVGLKSQDYYEVLSGLQPGETVVTSANFLIDSESKLRGVLQNATKGQQPAAPNSRGGQ